jgi:hypothetical protein
MITMMTDSTDREATPCQDRLEASPYGGLSLAAAPTFALMALLTALGGAQPDALCALMQDTSPLTGMVPMYLLMSVFHSGPWLKLISNWRGGGTETTGHKRR